MSRTMEEEMIRLYIKRNKRDRILWELNNPHKRDQVIWRFNTPKNFIDKCLHPVGYMDRDHMEKILFKLSGATNVYYMGEDYIGHLTLYDAVIRANKGYICIIYCGNGIGYYQGEQECGAPPRFLLSVAERLLI